MVTNDCSLQYYSDNSIGEPTPDHNKLLCLTWNRIDDTIYAKKKSLEYRS